MTRKRVSLFAALVAGAALVVGGVSFAQNPPPGPPGPGFGRRMGPPAGPMGLLRGLDLTQAQRDQFKALAEARRERGQALATRLQELNQALEAELFADAPDQGRIEQLTIDLNLAQREALDARIASRLEVAQVLTPEQRQQMREAPGRFGRRGPRGAGRTGGR